MKSGEDELKFEVGKYYRILIRDRYGHFKAKCVSRTAKTATFMATINGSTWYMEKFTLKAARSDENLQFDGKPMECMSSRKAAKHCPHGVFAYACDEIETVEKREYELRRKCQSAVEQALS